MIATIEHPAVLPVVAETEKCGNPACAGGLIRMRYQRHPFEELRTLLVECVACRSTALPVSMLAARS